MDIQLSDGGYFEGREFKDTSLFSLVFKENSPFLTDEENEILFSKIKDFIFYSYHNENGDFKKSSMTSIITFK